jgi:hypothetical protein
VRSTVPVHSPFVAKPEPRFVHERRRLQGVVPALA